MNKYFFIVTTDKYPEGDAGAVREHSFALIFKELGYTPIVIGLGACTDFSIKEYDGIKYTSFRYPKNDKLSKAMSYILYAMNFKKLILKYEPTDISGILFVNGSETTLKSIKKYALKHNIGLYHDSVEWYSPSEFKKGEKAPGYIKNNKLNTEWIDKNFKVFAISSFLKDHFNKRGIDALRVPVIMDVKKINAEKNTNPDYIKIVYAGQMGPKDKIGNFVKALPLIDKEELKKIKIFLIGITKQSFEAVHGPIDEKCTDCITFTGRIPRSEVLEHLKSADFTMLLRPEDERYAKAGFPTKVVESLSSATPVICNYTSDLNMYLKNRENAVIVNGTSVDDCVESLKTAIGMSFEERQAMQQNARKTAEEEFDYREYKSSVREFIS